MYSVILYHFSCTFVVHLFNQFKVLSLSFDLERKILQLFLEPSNLNLFLCDRLSLFLLLLLKFLFELGLSQDFQHGIFARKFAGLQALHDLIELWNCGCKVTELFVVNEFNVILHSFILGH